MNRGDNLVFGADQPWKGVRWDRALPWPRETSGSDMPAADSLKYTEVPHTVSFGT